MRRHTLGLLLLWSATALAQGHDAPPPAPTGPSGSAQPVDPYANPSTPPPPSTNIPPESPTPAQPPPPSQGAPAPSQQQPPPQAPEPNTTPPDAKPTPPASEQKPQPSTDKPAPAPVDQPAQPTDKPAQSNVPSTSPVTSLYPPGETPPTTSAPGETPPVDVAKAPPAPPAATIDVANAPPACRDAGSRVSSRDHNTALAAKVSFAICTASSAIAGLSLVDAEASVNDLDHATANAFALLDEVATSSEPRWRIVALHAQGDLLGQMTRRMLDTVPPPGAGAPQSAVALHDSRLQLLQPHLQPWTDRAQHAFAQVDQLARANPPLAKDQLVGSAVADSRRRMTNGVATR